MGAAPRFCLYRIITGVGVFGLGLPGVNRTLGAWHVDRCALALEHRVPPPPTASALVEAELAEVRAAQAALTPVSTAQIRADADRDMGRVAAVLDGPVNGAGARRLARTLAWHEKLLLGPVKARYARARPFHLDPTIVPVIPRPFSPGYPSGHATIARLWALALGMASPPHADVLAQRARTYAFQRLAAGVHLRSDVEAGLAAADVIFAAMLEDDGFHTLVARVATELATGASDLPQR